MQAGGGQQSAPWDGLEEGGCIGFREMIRRALIISQRKGKKGNVSGKIGCWDIEIPTRGLDVGREVPGKNAQARPIAEKEGR